MNLFYLANPAYGGWVTFTSHLAIGLGINTVFKIGKRTESRYRDFGYGILYQNISFQEIPSYENVIITALEKKYLYLLRLFNNPIIVIHDPTEVSDQVAVELKKYRIITIRKSVKDFLLKKYNIVSEFISHPYVLKTNYKNVLKSGAISISRIDFDKNIDILLKANYILMENGFEPIKIYGSCNRLCVFHSKLNEIGFDQHYCGRFEKRFDAVSNLLLSKKYVVDMSTIKNDGGGTQYTFLEAIDNGCTLIVNRKWLKSNDELVENANCLCAETPEELADIIMHNKKLEDFSSSASSMMSNHRIELWQTITAHQE